tara:strand:- start:68 stop:334 length:267 start_codon:yes stop_codon:yes gene_type:complete
MPIDPKLLEILCCPVSKQSLNLLSLSEITFLNEQIDKGMVINAENEKITEHLTEGLITANRQRIFRIEKNIPIMLENQCIPTDQFESF